MTSKPSRRTKAPKPAARNEDGKTKSDPINDLECALGDLQALIAAVTAIGEAVNQNPDAASIALPWLGYEAEKARDRAQHAFTLLHYPVSKAAEGAQ